MNVFETAQLTNDRLNGGSKSSVTLAIVSKIILLCKLAFGRAEEGIALISSGNVDNQIISLINYLDDENELKMMEKVQNFFTPRLHLVRNINAGMRILKLLGLLGLAIIILRLIS